jgi:ATP-binding cassette subfamily B protein
MEKTGMKESQKVAGLFIEAVRLVRKSSPGWSAANIWLAFAASFLPLLLLWLFRLLVDQVTAGAGPALLAPSVIWLIVAVVTTWFLDEAASDAGSYIKKRQSSDLEKHMYGLLHDKASRLDLINFERPEYFDTLTRAVREAPRRPDSILNNIMGLLRGGISLLLMGGLVVTLDWKLAVLLVAANIPAVWLRLSFAGILYRSKKELTPEERKAAYFNWLLTGDRPSRELRLFGLGGYFSALFRKSFDNHRESEIAIIRKRTLIEMGSDLFKALAFMAAIVLIAVRTSSGSITIGSMAMYLLAFRQGMLCIKDIFGSAAALYEDSLYIGDVFAFLGLEERIKAEEPVSPAAAPTAILSVSDLSFSYPGSEKTVLESVSFEIRKGEIVALAGANGAGKSTLVRLLCRLYDPGSGSVRIDGQDIRHFEPEEYRRLFSVVFQDFMLYNLSAGENIRLGDILEKTGTEKVRSAASAAGINSFLSALPGGYETVIGNLFDDSRELSWGEWQKLALARALYRDAPVLILDEPSSALDADTEHEIFSRLRELTRGRTTILISHRLLNVSLADRIIVLDKGSVAETGTHNELMAAGGLYHKMFIKQNGRFNTPG